MARYREKRPFDEVEAIFYTGENVEKIKEFLGENYVGLNVEKGENREIFFKQNVDYISKEAAYPMRDVIVKYQNDTFESIDRHRFLDEWERVD